MGVSTPTLVGQSAAFEGIMQTIEAVAGWDSSVIITGETGTGKEMVARMIHALSERRTNVFVPLDCTTLTGQLFESQLFGHVKGAFTSAHSDSLGFFRAADGGTLFLDEIGEIPLELQSKLLRVLQEGTVTPLGSTKSYKVNVRVICATNRDLHNMVVEKKFRDDLYYRLNVMTMEVPPLRERHEDVVLLANHFLEKQARLYSSEPKRLSEDAQKVLMDYPWPGNVRELANIMERAYILSQSEEVTAATLPAEIKMAYSRQAETSRINRGITSLDEAQKNAVVEALNASNGRKMAAARMLKIDHRKLGRLMDKYNVQACFG